MSEKKRKSAIFTRTWISDQEFLSASELPGEEWKQFDHFRGAQFSSLYEVSNKGRVRRVGQPVLKGSISFDGYYEVGLTQRGGSQRNVRVHQLVLSMFTGEPLTAWTALLGST